jgi:Flp pilus assembly protein TadG
MYERGLRIGISGTVHDDFNFCAVHASFPHSWSRAELHGPWLGCSRGTVLRVLLTTYRANSSGDSSGEDGGAIVEMAIASVLFLAALFGIIQACWALYVYNYVNEAAREATRYAIVRGGTYSPTNCTAPGPATCVAQAGSTGDIAQYVRSLAYPGVDSSKLTVSTTWPGTSGTPSCPSAPCNNPGNLVKVVVSYPFSFNIPFAPAATFTVASTSQLVISQ